MQILHNRRYFLVGLLLCNLTAWPLTDGATLRSADDSYKPQFDYYKFMKKLFRTFVEQQLENPETARWIGSKVQPFSRLFDIKNASYVLTVPGSKLPSWLVYYLTLKTATTTTTPSTTTTSSTPSPPSSVEKVVSQNIQSIVLATANITAKLASLQDLRSIAFVRLANLTNIIGYGL